MNNLLILITIFIGYVFIIGLILLEINILIRMVYKIWDGNFKFKNHLETWLTTTIVVFFIYFIHLLINLL